MLKANENCLFFPSLTPQVDLSPLDHIRPRPGEYFAVMDPPREKTAGGVMLRVSGDGWADRHTELSEMAEQDYCRKEAEALRRIDVFLQDPKSTKNKQLAFMASEVALAAHRTWQATLDPEPPGAALEQRADAYTVAKVGAGVCLTPGDRVMIAPYAARRWKNLFGVKDLVMVGREDPWEDITIMLMNQVTREWEPMSNWIAVQFAVKTVSVETKLRTFLNTGMVLKAGPQAESSPGDIVALHRDRKILRPDNTKWFATRWGPWDGKGVMLVREVDSDGVRRVLATIEEGHQLDQ